MATYQGSNLELAKKISKLVRGQIEPDRYPMDDVNIMSLLTSIWTKLTGEVKIFASTYEASRLILTYLEHNPYRDELRDIFNVIFGVYPPDDMEPSQITEIVIEAIKELQKSSAGHRYNEEADALAEGRKASLGELSQANGVRSHAEGTGTIANGDNQHVTGTYNIPNDTALRITGKGTDDEHRSNAEVLSMDGVLWVASDVTIPGHSLSTKLTAAQTKALINTSIGAFGNLSMQVVNDLPSNGRTWQIYFVPNEENHYDEYMWVDAAWRKIGETDLNLDGYFEEVSLADIYKSTLDAQAVNGLKTLLESHVHDGRIHTSVEQEVDDEVLTFNWNAS